MGNEDLQNLLKAGIAAAKARNKAEARRLLEQVLELDDSNEAAWMWLASVVDKPSEKRICLENVLELNPNNVRARQALAQLGPSPQAAQPPSQAASSQAAPGAPLGTGASRTAARTAPVRRGSNRSPLARAIDRNPVLFLGGGALAFLLIALGVILAVNQAPPPTVSVQNTRVPNIVPTNAPTLPALSTVVTVESKPLPTNTATQIDTPVPTPTPSPTLPPLSTYKLVFTGEGRNTTNQSNLYIIMGDGSGEKPLLTQTNKAYFSPSVSKNGQLAYVTIVDDKDQIFVTYLSGSPGNAITKLNGEHVSGLAWSPDGTKIAFAQSNANDDAASREIYVINSDGSSQQQITSNNTDDRDPTWSPDGKYLLYAEDTSSGQNFLQLIQYDLASKTSQQLTTLGGSNYSPAWSPDGSKIAFVSTKDGIPNVYYIAVTDPFTMNLVSVNGGSFTSKTPAWSPDSKYIVFASNRDGNAFDLWIATPDGMSMKKLTNSTNPKDNTYSAVFVPPGK